MHLLFAMNGMGYFIFGAFIVLIIYANISGFLKERRKEEERLLKERERIRWLDSPEGREWQANEQARIQRESEAALLREKQRLEEVELREKQRAEELAARKAREEIELLNRKKKLWNAYHESSSLDEISKMSGPEFENFLIHLLKKKGYTEVCGTPTSGDQGADIICVCPRKYKTAVQAKRHSKAVGNGAVQELLGGMRFYGCIRGIVITNNRFTPQAIAVAKVDNTIELYDYDWLQTTIRECFPPVIPEFDEEKYKTLVEPHVAEVLPANSISALNLQSLVAFHLTDKPIIKSTPLIAPAETIAAQSKPIEELTEGTATVKAVVIAQDLNDQIRDKPYTINIVRNKCSVEECTNSDCLFSHQCLEHHFESLKNSNDNKLAVWYKILSETLKYLTFREREILKLRAGLGDGYIYTSDEVAHIFKISESQLHEHEANIAEKLYSPVTREVLLSSLPY